MSEVMYRQLTFRQVAFDVLRHRLLLTYEADAENIDVDEVIRGLISVVAVP